jgi:hypothetical protein
VAVAGHASNRLVVQASRLPVVADVVTIGIYTTSQSASARPGFFYAESVSQQSPGLPDECRATLGMAARVRPNPAWVLQNVSFRWVFAKS